MMTRTMDDVLAEGRIVSAELLEASRRGDAVEVARIHETLNALQKEIMRLWRSETTVPTTTTRQD
jgi:hypothetical protein